MAISGPCFIIYNKSRPQGTAPRYHFCEIACWPNSGHRFDVLSGVDLNGQTRLAEALRDALHLLFRDFLQVLGWRLPVNAIEHHLAGLYLKISAQQCLQLLVGGIVKTFAVILAPG